MLKVIQIYLESLWLCLPYSKLELYFGVPILTAQAFKEESKKAGDFFFLSDGSCLRSSHSSSSEAEQAELEIIFNTQETHPP